MPEPASPPMPRTMHPRLAWLGALDRPADVLDWSLTDWTHVVRVARSLRLLARLAEAVGEAGLDDRLPLPVRQHLLAERRRSRARLRSLNWTLEHVGQALAPLDGPRLLLKGAAYLGQNLVIARGRLPSDLDILVPREHLAAAQELLKGHDWREVELDAHDQRYYREWSHEVPAMHNPRFELELDLHHGILPPVATTTVDPDLLLDRCMPSALPGWRVLCPVDQVLHSAAHLYLDSELRNRVRDLVDLKGLLAHFGRHSPFWNDLEARTFELGLQGPMALALHHLQHWLGADVPADMARRLGAAGLTPWRRAWLMPLLDSVMLPLKPDDAEPASRRMAARALLARYHWNRLPLHLLVPHLLRKSARRAPRSPLAEDADDN